MKIVPSNAQDRGAREQQEDSFGFSDQFDPSLVDHGGVLAVVADGMGGLRDGRRASATAVGTMLACFAAKDPGEPVRDTLDRAVDAAHAAVVRLNDEVGEANAIGTTLVAAVVHQARLLWASAGDSRIFLFRDGRLTQLTTDHVLARELDERVARGELAASEAGSHPERAALTSFLGISRDFAVDRSMEPLALAAGDVILLCSDGLWNGLAVGEIEALLAGDAAYLAEVLVRAVLDRRWPGQDNVTAVVMAVDPVDVTRLAERPVTSQADGDDGGPWRRRVTLALALGATAATSAYVGRITAGPPAPQAYQAVEEQRSGDGSSAARDDVQRHPVVPPLLDERCGSQVCSPAPACGLATVSGSIAGESER